MPKHAKNETNASPDQVNADPYEESRTGNNVELDQSNMTSTIEPIESGPFEAASIGDPVTAVKKKGKHGTLTPRQKKSRRMKRILIVIVIFLLILIGALGYFGYHLYQESQSLATQQTLQQQNAQDIGGLQGEDATDSSIATTKQIDVPVLTELFGKTQDEAIEYLQRGAMVTATKELDDKDDPVKTSVTIALTEDPSDSRSGTPTVYIGLDKDEKIIMAGYSAATTFLGYGSLSFTDAAMSENIIGKTLEEAGLAIDSSVIVLPEDKNEYSTYATDETTLVKEEYAFSGQAELNGQTYDWSSVLKYDYSFANSSGNLADTIRHIYIYLTMPSEPDSGSDEPDDGSGDDPDSGGDEE